MDVPKKYVVGADGGGTKTSVILVGMDGAVMAESSGGPTQIQTFGIRLVASTLFDLIRDCCKKIDCRSDALQSVVLGIAGSGRASVREELADLLHALSRKKKFPLRNISIETDARIALEAAFAGGAGIAVIAGTGSIALYRTEDGKMLRSGGWGKIVGDEGSGYCVARDALNAVMRQHDGRGDKTGLTEKAFAHFKISTHDELISKIYNEETDIASFAPIVFEAVAERDRIATMIMIKNAGELVEHVRVLTMRARPRRKMPVALMGGLLGNENPYSKTVKEKLVSSLPNVIVQKPKFPAAFGAAIIALNAFR